MKVAVPRRRAFTLLELLITIGLIAALLSLLLPALGNMAGLARSHRCKMSLRAAAFDFAMFADDELHPNRGEDERRFQGRFFRLETFIDSQYGAGEFWRHGEIQTATLPDQDGNDPLRCPEIKATLQIARHARCVDGAILTPRAVSFGFNMRLHRAEVTFPNGMVGARTVLLSSADLQHPNAPLAWDVDGELAYEKRQRPVISAPTLGSQAVYAGERYWFPALRHNRMMNVAFLGGHVLSSSAPLDEPGWEWSYQGGD
ncbi:MAG: prepilin-type N-terminal cleavage/methylation domain-containing protein [Planctomycetota bacterium]|nr:prepilin-type N-terminal cleavage/methylation domain-containing protein [Planctomycetota bacterium]